LVTLTLEKYKSVAMHPAFSVIFLTTLIGAGQGLFLALYSSQIYALARLLSPPDNRSFYVLGSFVALGFLGAGLIASFFHLGHPERAWRAGARWRSSWLSREVLALPAFMGALALWGLAHWLGWNPVVLTVSSTVPLDLSALLGLTAVVLAFLLFLCTGMIYAGIEFLEEWHHYLTVLNFTLAGSASGFTLAALLAAVQAPALVGFYTTWAVILTFVAALFRTASLLRNRHLGQRSSLSTAIGMRHNRIVQKAQGAMAGSFNTREFFHGARPAVLATVRITFWVLAFPVPALLLAGAYWDLNPALAAAAFLTQYAGLVAERWYFFAEARHPQNLYYQSVA
jgi:DMSO reductase anchor subunit